MPSIRQISTTAEEAATMIQVQNFPALYGLIPSGEVAAFMRFFLRRSGQIAGCP